MRRLLLGRLALTVPMFLVVSFLSFLLIAIAPGDPAVAVLGASATPERVADMREQLGLDDPLLVQYASWLGSAAHGDFGESLLTAQPVSTTIRDRMGATMSLVIGTTILSTVVGLLLGMFGALRGGWASRVLEWISIGIAAIPPFWLGFLLVAWFAISLRWLPATGFIPPGNGVSKWLRALILPVVTLTAAPAMGIAKQTKDSMHEALAKDFVAALRADGLSERRVVWVHALRNAAIPIVTLIGVYIVAMLGATVFAETVFSIPGLGSLVVQSSQSGDFPVVQGVVVVLCLGVVVVNLLIELIYAWLNPKRQA